MGQRSNQATSDSF